MRPLERRGQFGHNPASPPDTAKRVRVGLKPEITEMTNRSLASRAAARGAILFGLAVVATSAAPASAQTQTWYGQHFCVIESLSAKVPCPPTPPQAEPVTAETFMQIHMDNQKIGSEVSTNWEHLRLGVDPTAVGSVSEAE